MREVIMVWYKGKEYEKIMKTDMGCVIKDKFGNCFALDEKSIYNTKEDSLANWEPHSFQDVLTFHYLKFGKQDKSVALSKVTEEIQELEDAIATLQDYIKTNGFNSEDEMVQLLLSRCSDEYADVIQAGCCLFQLDEAMEENFKKVGKRIYSDGYKHDKEGE